MPNSTCLPNPFTVAYDPTTSRLCGHWPASVDDSLLRAHYADLLTAACAHGGCRFWLLDMRGRNWHSPEFGRWFSTVFTAAAHAALHQPLFIAYVLSPAHHAVANTPGVQATQSGSSTHDVYPFFFDSAAAAREWLAHQQALDLG
ncbi:MAG: hypothetical protein ACRYFZ_13640 [Janthinobacterium lividum]